MVARCRRNVTQNRQGHNGAKSFVLQCSQNVTQTEKKKKLKSMVEYRGGGGGIQNHAVIVMNQIGAKWFQSDVKSV